MADDLSEPSSSNRRPEEASAGIVEAEVSDRFVNRINLDIKSIQGEMNKFIELFQSMQMEVCRIAKEVEDLAKAQNTAPTAAEQDSNTMNPDSTPKEICFN